MSLPSIYKALAILLVICQLVRSEDSEEAFAEPLFGIKSDGKMYTTAEIIAKHKYKPETHNVTTKDGYRLTIFRVAPPKQPAEPVLLQHGYSASSDIWITDPKALAFTLSSAGYDVWLINIRGNVYSRNHETLKPDDAKFWDFSWHEMGSEDVPAVVDYILQATNQSAIHLVGHSMGTTISYVMLSTKPEYNKKIKTLIGMSPVAYLSKVEQLIGPDGMVEDMANMFMKRFQNSGKVEVFPRKDIAKNNKTQLSCQDLADSFRDLCEGKMQETELICGGPYMPAGTSFKTLEHFFQMGSKGQMNFFQHATPKANKDLYGTEQPPSYFDKFNNIIVPTFLWNSDFDQVVLPEDVDNIVKKLPKVVKDNRITAECFDHLSYVLPRVKKCIPVRDKMYKEIIEAFKSVNKQ